MNEPVNLGNPRTEWEQPIWTPEPLFAGETVFCVACGPSLTPETAEKLKGRRVIAVNNAVYAVPHADVLFFTDAGWFEAFNDANPANRRTQSLCGRPGNDLWPRRQFIEAFPGLVVSFAPVAKRVLDDPSNPYPMARKPRVMRIKAQGAATHQPKRAGAKGFDPGFPPVGSREIWAGRSSGHTAISLAIAMGASRIGLVAYDMRVVAGREHFHRDYHVNHDGTGRDLTQYEKEFVPGFGGWNEAALASGVQVLNCTPGSALTEFPFADLDEVLHGVDCRHHDSAGSHAAHYA